MVYQSKKKNQKRKIFGHGAEFNIQTDLYDACVKHIVVLLTLNMKNSSVKMFIWFS